MTLNLSAFGGKKEKKTGLNLGAFGVKSSQTLTAEPRVFRLRESLGGGSFLVGGKADRDVSSKTKADIRGGSFQDTDLEVDHIFPLALGGTNELDNLQGKKSPLSFAQKIGAFFGKEYSAGERPADKRQAGKAKSEREIIDDYKAGKIGLGEARVKIAQAQRIATGMEEKDPEKIGLMDLYKGGFEDVAKWGKAWLTKSADKTRAKQKEAIESVDAKDKRRELIAYYGSQRKIVSPLTGTATIKSDYTQGDIAKMSDEQVEKLYGSVYKSEYDARQETAFEFVTATLPTASRLFGETAKRVGNINKLKQGITETPEVIDLRGTEMIEPKKIGRITEQGFVKVEPTVAKTVEAPKELNLDAFKKSVAKEADPITTSIQKAKTEGKSFDEFVNSKITRNKSMNVDEFETSIPIGDIKHEAVGGTKLKAGRKITKPIEAEFNIWDNTWRVSDGQHRVAQAVENGDKTIPAKVSYVERIFNKNDAGTYTSIKSEKSLTKSQLKQLWDTEIKAPKVEKPIVKAPEPKKSITAQKLNEAMPDEFKLNENYDVITLKGELDRASKEISTNSEEALRKAFDKNERVDRRIAKLEEFAQIAKRDNDYDAVNRLFTQANKVGTETAQGLNMMKALHSVNPEYKYMQDIVDMRLKKIKVGVKDIKQAKKDARKIIKQKASDIKYKTKTSLKVKDAQRLLDKLIC